MFGSRTQSPARSSPSAHQRLRLHSLCVLPSSAAPLSAASHTARRAGLLEGDPFEVRVGEYRPQAQYEGRADGPLNVFGQPIYK